MMTISLTSFRRLLQSPLSGRRVIGTGTTVTIPLPAHAPPRLLRVASTAAVIVHDNLAAGAAIILHAETNLPPRR